MNAQAAEEDAEKSRGEAALRIRIVRLAVAGRRRLVAGLAVRLLISRGRRSLLVARLPVWRLLGLTLRLAVGGLVWSGRRLRLFGLPDRLGGRLVLGSGEQEAGSRRAPAERVAGCCPS